MPFNFNYISAFSWPRIQSDFSHSRYELLHTCKSYLIITYVSKSHTATYITIEVHNGQLLHRIIYKYMLLLVMVSCRHYNVQTCIFMCVCVCAHAHACMCMHIRDVFVLIILITFLFA